MLLFAIIVLVVDVATCDTFVAMFAVDFNFCLWLFVVVVPAPHCRFFNYSFREPLSSWGVPSAVSFFFLFRSETAVYAVTLSLKNPSRLR